MERLRCLTILPSQSCECLCFPINASRGSWSPHCNLKFAFFTDSTVKFLLFRKLHFIHQRSRHYFTLPVTCHSVYICPFLHFIPLLLNFLSHSPHLTRFISLSVLPTPSALRSCSTGDSLLSSASIRSAKSAPALAPPLPVLLHHHHHPLLPPLVDQLAGTRSLYYLSAFL